MERNFSIRKPRKTRMIFKYGSPQSRPPACGAVLNMEGEAVLSREDRESVFRILSHAGIDLCDHCVLCG
jgi:hypothetical protein